LGNVNTSTYWNRRFGSGDWCQKGGYSQTRIFAEEQICLLQISKEFSGTLLDFGCGAGDSFPVYSSAYPRARLIGIDFSQEAIRLARVRFGSIAQFICGTHKNVPDVDIIIASNVLEHVDDDCHVATCLKQKCRELYIVVPYKEKITSQGEHVRSYDSRYFDQLGPVSHQVFLSKAWSQYGKDLCWHVYAKNFLRPLFGRALIRRNKQIIFRIPGLQLLPFAQQRILQAVEG
jgi:hypothetical protein